MRRILPSLLVAMGLSVATPGAQTQRIPADCSRACLEALVNQYLDAVVAHDPKRLPLSADVKYTENEQLLDVGDGFWKTATGRGNYNHYFSDPVTGQAAWMGTMKEKAGPLLMALRLRAQSGRLVEIESGFFRAGGGGPNNIAAMDALRKPEALWLQPIPAAQRSSRQQLIEIANAYFEGVQKNDGKGFYPFTDDCDRIENGSHTTNTPSPRPNTPGGFNYMGLDCNCVFDMDGTVTSIKLTSGETADMSNFAGRASSIDVTEAFRIEGNQIRRVEMIGSGVPYHFNSPWPGLSGR